MFLKKLFLKISQNLQESTYARRDDPFSTYALRRRDGIKTRGISIAFWRHPLLKSVQGLRGCMKITKFERTYLMDGPESFFNHFSGLRPATLLKKRLWNRCYPVNFPKFLRISFLQNTSGQLLPCLILEWLVNRRLIKDERKVSDVFNNFCLNTDQV